MKLVHIMIDSHDEDEQELMAMTYEELELELKICEEIKRNEQIDMCDEMDEA